MPLYDSLNATVPADLFAYPNAVTGGLFWTLVLIAAYVTGFVVLQSRNDAGRSFAATSFFTGILATFFFVMGWIDETTVIIFVFMAILSAAMMLSRQ